MDNQDKKKRKPAKKTISMYLPAIPMSVHKKIVEKYKPDLIGKRRRDFTVKETYTEFLIEQSNAIQ